MPVITVSQGLAALTGDGFSFPIVIYVCIKLLKKFHHQ